MFWRCALLLALTTFAAAADKGPFDAVPKSLRASLVRRLKLLEGYEKAQRWDKVYELASSKYLTTTKRDAFVRMMSEKSFALVSFTPTLAKTSPVDVDQWFVWGQIVVQTDTGQECYEGLVVADLIRGKWYFKPIVESIVNNVDRGPVKCTAPASARP